MNGKSSGQYKEEKMDHWSFVHAADIHLGSPRSYRYDEARNDNWAAARKQMEKIGPDLILIGGDMTRDGDPHEYEMQMAKDDFDSLPFPYHAIPGNVEVGNKHTHGHKYEILNTSSDKIEKYKEYFGPVNWTFTHKNVRFSGFYAAVAGTGIPEEKEFWDFMEGLHTAEKAEYHVAMMHYVLFTNAIDESNYDPNGNRDEFMHWYNNIDEPHRGRIYGLLKEAGVNMVLCGHVHLRRPEMAADGMRFLWTAAAGGRPQHVERYEDGDGTIGFYRVNVTDQGLDPVFVPVDPSSPKEPRGPFGHFYTNDHAAKGFPDEYDHILEKGQ